MKTAIEPEELESARTLHELLRTLSGVFDRIDSASIRLAAASSDKLRSDLDVFRQYRAMFKESVEMTTRVKQADPAYSDASVPSSLRPVTEQYDLHAVEMLFLASFLAGQLTGQARLLSTLKRGKPA